LLRKKVLNNDSQVNILREEIQAELDSEYEEKFNLQEKEFEASMLQITTEYEATIIGLENKHSQLTAQERENIRVECLRELRDDREKDLYQTTRAWMENEVEIKLRQTLPLEIEMKIRKELEEEYRDMISAEYSWEY
jgi:hypothetical protein